MAQLSQEQIKRIAMGALGLIVVIGAVWFFLLKPQADKIEEFRADITELEDNIKKGRAAITGAQNLAEETSVAMEKYESIRKDIPQGTPIAWFPPRVNNYWRLQGFTDVSTESSGTLTPREEGLEDFEILTWKMMINEAPFVDFGISLAEFENKEKLLQINNLTINAGGADPEFQNYTISMGLLLPKEDEE